MKKYIACVFIVFVIVSCNRNFEQDTQENKNRMNKSNIEKQNIDGNSLFFDVKLKHPKTDKNFDTIIGMNYLANNLYWLFDFNYPSLNSMMINENALRFYNDSISIVIEKEKFDSSKHEYTCLENSRFVEKFGGLMDFFLKKKFLY